MEEQQNYLLRKENSNSNGGTVECLNNDTSTSFAYGVISFPPSRFLHIAVAQGRRALAYVLATKMAASGSLDMREHNGQVQTYNH